MENADGECSFLTGGCGLLNEILCAELIDWARQRQCLINVSNFDFFIFPNTFILNRKTPSS